MKLPGHKLQVGDVYIVSGPALLNGLPGDKSTRTVTAVEPTSPGRLRITTRRSCDGDVTTSIATQILNYDLVGGPSFDQTTKDVTNADQIRNHRRQIGL